jgi:hypothetical protein
MCHSLAIPENLSVPQSNSVSPSFVLSFSLFSSIDYRVRPDNDTGCKHDNDTD